MSKPKTSTGDLISIYRLEFYKKKEDWILCNTKDTPVQEPTEDKETNVSADKPDTDGVLNITYKIYEPNVFMTSLNEAFFESDSEDSRQFRPEVVADQYPDVVPSNWWFQDWSTRRQELNQEVNSEGALETFSEFMRGAHCAPHSSELDLQDDELFEELSPNDLATKSTKQLLASVVKHSTALDSLSLELRVRELMRSRTYVPLNNYQEYTQHTTDLNYVQSMPDADIYLINNLQNSLPNFHEGAIGRGRGRGRLRDYQELGVGRGRARFGCFKRDSENAKDSWSNKNLHCNGLIE